MQQGAHRGRGEKEGRGRGKSFRGYDMKSKGDARGEEGVRVQSLRRQSRAAVAPEETKAERVEEGPQLCL